MLRERDRDDLAERGVEKTSSQTWGSCEDESLDFRVGDDALP